ncbi:class III lanthionine synthetase LanKC [Actinophytocola xanthii]|nr:class III lanthionine synthetase LanKC [Actinophytocola xanthii]
MRYLEFCLTDPLFYDSPREIADAAARDYLADLTVPAGWTASRKGTWTFLRPPAASLPAQGWKVHASATLDNARDVLREVWDYCVPRGVTFKFLASPVDLLLRNSKYADRAGSGKFVAIYPQDVDQLGTILRELGAVLDGSKGPYVLSDIRWGSGPLYVRYGGFAERFCRSDNGELVLAIATPDGRLVPDQRRASFTPPSWVDIPEVVATSIEARTNQGAATRFPFRIVRSLHFSNGGGVYLAVDSRSGREVVLKEAPPYAGLDQDGTDAVQRLLRERDFLKKLANTGVVPELYEHLVCWEHHFLVEEYIEGRSVGREMVERIPLIRAGTDDGHVREYAAWALGVLDKVSRCVRVMHDNGIAFGDLHPHNILLRPDGGVRFIDLEMASYLTDEERPALGAPGYVAPDGRAGGDADRYALACLRLSMFLPLTTLFPLDRDKAAMLADSVVRRFGLPESYATEIIETTRDRGGAGPRKRSRAAELAADVDAGTPDWPVLCRSMRDGILASATPTRTDRLFPGDIAQFSHTGIGMAYGAAGVLHALAAAGFGRFPEYEDWLLNSVRQGRCDGQVGFYTGLHGVAYVLSGLGRDDDALAVLDRAMLAPRDALPASLFAGLAGVGLNLLHFALRTGDSSLLDQAVDLGTELAGRLGLPLAPAATTGTQRAGLLHGPSGAALLFVRLFEATDDQRFLDLAEAALRRDLDRCVEVGDGSLQLDEGWRAMPYVETGSVGVGLVLRELLRHRERPDLATALSRIRRAAEAELVICSGLFNGRAGLITFLTAAGGDDAALNRHLRRLAWHIVSYQDHVAFPGDQLMRLSMDLATGSAGVLLAVRGALDHNGPMLPFLTPPESRVSRQPRRIATS